ncbi:MAG: hypothetical protein KDA58_04490 [Planctomycetaceae bacterium]|nr:hypothetical protein [Planctomycetaceae bacterium]
MCRLFACSIVVLGLLAFMPGCQKSEDTEVSDQRKLPDWMVEDAPETASGEPNFEELAAARLSLQLNPGDRFPLKKIVRQELTQSTLSGEPDVSQSELEVMFAISVLEKQSDRIKLGVRYDRVRYNHDVAGDKIAFDSNRDQGDVPVAVRAYRDMVGDGFAFWIGEDNQIVAVDGFTDFLRRCMRNVPEELRASVMLGIEAGSGEDGIANFVDNSIGLLPYGTPRRPGDVWERPKFIARPIPMQLQNEYTLKDLTADEAQIAVRGTIAPSNVGSPETHGMHVRVTGGTTSGTCTIYRNTGLPKSSHVERTVDMLVTMAPVEFRQQKRIITTIESFPVVSGAPVMQVGFER